MRGRSTRMQSWLFKIARRQGGFSLLSLPIVRASQSQCTRFPAAESPLLSRLLAAFPSSGLKGRSPLRPAGAAGSVRRVREFVVELAIAAQHDLIERRSNRNSQLAPAPLTSIYNKSHCLKLS